MRITKKYLQDDLEKTIQEYEKVTGKKYQNWGYSQIPGGNLKAAILYGQILQIDYMLGEFKS
jgi:hypothetical protein